MSMSLVVTIKEVDCTFCLQLIYELARDTKCAKLELEGRGMGMEACEWALPFYSIQFHITCEAMISEFIV